MAGARLISWLARPLVRLARMVRTAAIVLQWLATTGWSSALVTMMHNDAMPRGSTYTCISTLRELFTDIFSFRHPLRSCLNNAPTRIQQRWRVQPDPVLRRCSPICYTLSHMGTGGGHLQGHDRREWNEQGRV